MDQIADFDRVIFEAARDIILVAPLTPEGPGCFVRVNPYACERLGYTAEELLGMRPFDITTERPPAMLDELRANGYVRGEMLFVTREGTSFPCDFIIRTIRVHERPYLLAIVRDVSELAEARRANEVLVRELSTPLLRVARNVLAMPVIGEVNEARAELMTQRLLDALASQSPAWVILDLTGMEAGDPSTAARFGRMIAAAQLLGTKCVIAGISPSLALMLTTLDDLPKVSIFATLADALDASRAPGQSHR